MNTKLNIDAIPDGSIELTKLSENAHNVLKTLNSYPCIDMGNGSLDTTLEPNTFYVWGEVEELFITLKYMGDLITDTTQEYVFQFTSGETPTTLSLPASIKWTTEPTIQPNKVYQVSILNKLGTILEFDK